MGLLCICALLFGGVVGYWISTSISRSIDEALHIAKNVAEGDLRSHIQVKTRDELGQLLQALGIMNRNLVKTVADVRDGASTIAATSAQIATDNGDLSVRTEQQASSLEETASSMEELAATVEQNLDNARNATTIADNASTVAEQGHEVISQVVATMDEINNASKKVVEIISVIDGIAFQTNILALNAAVEAARAGTEGRGFAVVASEVRSLAHRSAAAAREIKVLIGNSGQKVEHGTQLVREAGTTMANIVESVRRVNDIMHLITTASREQHEGIAQMNQAILQMDKVTQQNALLVEEAAGASQAMLDQAQRLNETVNIFQIPENSSTALLPRLRRNIRSNEPS